MILKLTQSGKDFFDNIRLKGFTTSHDFVYLFNCKNDPCHAAAEEAGYYPETFICTPESCNIAFHHHYNCNFGEEMVVDDEHYNEDLQAFVNQGYLEII